MRNCHCAFFLFKILITYLPNSAIFGWANISKLTFCRHFWWLPTYFSLKPTLTFLLSDFEAAFDPAMYFTAQPANPSTLKQVDLSIAWSLKIFLHLKWTSDQEGCVAKFEKKLSRNIYFIWAPDFLTGLAGLPRYSLASAKYSSFPPNPPLNQSLSCAMAKRIGYNIYIYTHG